MIKTKNRFFLADLLYFNSSVIYGHLKVHTVLSLFEIFLNIMKYLIINVNIIYSVHYGIMQYISFSVYQYSPFIINSLLK